MLLNTFELILQIYYKILYIKIIKILMHIKILLKFGYKSIKINWRKCK